MSPDSGVVDIYKQSDGISKSVAKKAAKAYGAKEISYVHLGKIWQNSYLGSEVRNPVLSG